MNEIENIDLGLLLLIFLSVLVGMRRGFSGEVLRLAVYVFSCVFGYMLVPFFQPRIASVFPSQELSAMLALGCGTLLAWIILRVVTSSWNKSVQNSQFGKLDRSLGLFFGLGRGVVIVLCLCVVMNFIAPKKVEKSRILSLSSVQLQKVLNDLSGSVENQEDKAKEEKQELSEKTSEKEAGKETDASSVEFKKALLSASQGIKVKTVEGEKTLLSVFSTILAKTMIDNGMAISPEITENVLRSRLQGKSMDEIQDDVRSKALEDKALIGIARKLAKENLESQAKNEEAEAGE